MKGEIRDPRPGEVFYLFRDKIHFVGTVQGDEKLYVFWLWLNHKQRRHYFVVAEWEYVLDWKYLRKKRNA